MEETRIHWADVIARATEGLQVIATGITPSGNIHVGNMREVVTADAIFRAIKDVGKAARLIYVADSYDPLRTVYPFLPTSYKEYVGMPLSCLLYTSDAADDLLCVDLGGRRII